MKSVGRLGRACFALGRLASTAGKAAVRECYFATVHSVLMYGVELWAGMPRDAPARELFREYKILTLPCILIQQVAIFTHENLDLFKRKGSNPRHLLRSNRHENRLVTEPHKLTKLKKSV